MMVVKKMNGLAERELGNVGTKEWGAKLRQEKIVAVKAIIEAAFSSVIKVENASDAFNELMKRVILRTE